MLNRGLQFLLKHMVETLRWDLDVILNGSLIVSICYNKLIFKDSLSLFNTPLSALPKIMRINEIKKIEFTFLKINFAYYILIYMVFIY